MRTHPRALVALFLAAGLAAPAFAADDKPAALAWKFEKGKAFYQEVTSDTTQTIKVKDKEEVKRATKSTFYYEWTPDEVGDKDKPTLLKLKIVGVKMETDVGGEKATYDSTKLGGGQTGPLAAFCTALDGAEFKVTLGPDGKVTKVEGRDELLKRLLPSAETKKALETILSEDALKQAVESALAGLPPAGTELKKDAKWERKGVKLPLGPLGAYSTDYTYTYDSGDDKTAKIKVEASVSHAAPADDAGGSLPFKIKKTDLKSAKAGAGTITFNKEKGWIESADLTVDAKGTLTVDSGDKPTDVEVAVTRKTTVKTTAENPVKKP